MLSKAILALTLSFTPLHPHHSHYKPNALSEYAECFQLVIEAVNDPEFRSDTFLLAILSLGTWEHLRRLASEPCAILNHHNGAVAVA